MEGRWPGGAPVRLAQDITCLAMNHSRPEAMTVARRHEGKGVQQLAEDVAHAEATVGG